MIGAGSRRLAVPRVVVAAALALTVGLGTACPSDRSGPDATPARPDASAPASPTEAGNLPVDGDQLARYPPLTGFRVRALLLPRTLSAALAGGTVDEQGRGGLELDLSAVTELVDGSKLDPRQIWGTVWCGPYPFEAAEARYGYGRLRRRARVVDGRATLDVARLLHPGTNSEGWTDQVQLIVRAELFEARAGADRAIGIYETVVWLKRRPGAAGAAARFERVPALSEAPRVGLVSSDDPSRVRITARTDTPATVTLVVDGTPRVTSKSRTVHRMELGELEPATEYRYRVDVGGLSSPERRFVTAQKAGEGELLFAIGGDSREGLGGGLNAYLGVNRLALERLLGVAYREGAQLLLVGGDLVDGYTDVPADFEAQLAGWRHATSGYAAERWIVPVMGNHEALLRSFVPQGEGAPKAKFGGVHVDRWPYATESAEAVFAEAFDNPMNGPEPSDPRRPPYKGNVFSFQRGPVRFIGFNNNYWYSSHADAVGGSPEGYLFPDQLAWIEAELRAAEADATVRHVFMYAQEPVFPCGGHVSDAMWYGGRDSVRAHTWRDGRLVPEPAGMIAVRNQLVAMVGAASKVRAVIASDEHAYCRLRIDNATPIGVPADDRDGDGRIEWDGPDGAPGADGGAGTEPASPLETLKRPIWFLTSGGLGAPYYSEQPTPWTNYWQGQQDGAGGAGSAFRYSSQEHILLVACDQARCSVRAVNPVGEVFDSLGDLR